MQKNLLILAALSGGIWLQSAPMTRFLRRSLDTLQATKAKKLASTPRNSLANFAAEPDRGSTANRESRVNAKVDHAALIRPFLSRGVRARFDAIDPDTKKRARLIHRLCRDYESTLVSAGGTTGVSGIPVSGTGLVTSAPASTLG